MTGQLDWADNPNKITLVDSMEQIGGAYEDALVRLAMAPSELQAVRLAVEQEVAAPYQENGESEEERHSKLRLEQDFIFHGKWHPSSSTSSLCHGL